MKWKTILLTLFVFQAAFGLSAPYLYPPASVGDSAVQLTWRNNATDYQGIVILRKSGTAGQFTAINTVVGTAISYMDKSVVGSQIPYVYALTAYSQTAQADTSNADSVIVPVPPQKPLVGPYNLNALLDSQAQTISISFTDSNTTEAGYWIFKSTNLSPFTLETDIPSPFPSSTGYITFVDTAISPNSWYQYYVVAYNSQKAVSCTTQTIYTYNTVAMMKEAFQTSKKYLVLTKAGSFPIKYKGWGLKSGDTVVLNETGLADSTFSIIDISNPVSPRYAGIGRSPAATMGRSTSTKGTAIFGSISGWTDTLIHFQYGAGIINVVKKTKLSLTWIPKISAFLSDTSLVFIGCITDIATSLFRITGYAAQEYSLTPYAISLLSSDTLWSYVNLDLWSSVFYNHSFFINAQIITGPTLLLVTDFAYKNPPTFMKFPVSNPALELMKIPRIIDGMLIDTSKLKDANNIFVDTVKNLVIGLSDTELSVWTYHAVMGVAEGSFKHTLSGRSLRILSGCGSIAAVISLPPHSDAVSVSIYDLAGREIRKFDNVRGEEVQWVPKRGAGVYIVKALIGSSLYTAKFVLSR